MKTAIENPNINHNGRTMAGIIILIIGSILLIDQLNLFFIPHWLFSWPMLLIAYGVYIGRKYNYRKPIWIWITILGTAFLFTENVPNAENFIWPVTIIGFGSWMVMKHSRNVNAEYPDNNKDKEI